MQVIAMNSISRLISPVPHLQRVEEMGRPARLASGLSSGGSDFHLDEESLAPQVTAAAESV